MFMVCWIVTQLSVSIRAITELLTDNAAIDASRDIDCEVTMDLVVSLDIPRIGS